ncbi:hypothetical protein F2Q68_00017576 [Brassica cretica]|uniref:Uncharacterized protein n=1 Tax=Brassica cretica TaxID=69181 RepID=A0A8S9HJ96_BRACR|nr:hypothetical protein F2Q68_00017576 [Brassica cretica]
MAMSLEDNFSHDVTCFKGRCYTHCVAQPDREPNRPPALDRNRPPSAELRDGSQPSPSMPAASHLVRPWRVQGGGGSAIKRLAAPPPLFKFACSDFGRPETSGVGEKLMEVDMLLLDSQATMMPAKLTMLQVHEAHRAAEAV